MLVAQVLFWSLKNKLASPIKGFLMTPKKRSRLSRTLLRCVDISAACTWREIGRCPKMKMADQYGVSRFRNDSKSGARPIGGVSVAFSAGSGVMANAFVNGVIPLILACKLSEGICRARPGPDTRQYTTLKRQLEYDHSLDTSGSEGGQLHRCFLKIKAEITVGGPCQHCLGRL